MAQMKELETNNKSSLQPAMLAFGSEKASPYSLASELGEGLIIAKNGMSKKKFLKQYCQGSIENDLSCAISILVGTQDAIHKWLRMSGHARCALWIEHDTLEGGYEFANSSLKLELVYRQRDYRISHVPILQGCKLVLSPANQLKLKQNRAKDVGKEDCEFNWNELQQHELDQMDSKHERKCIDWWKTTTMRWYILMKVPTFKKLKSMLCPGGALWEFRRLLSQVISLPEFLDIDFQNINLQERLTHHPYAVFLAGRDAIMTRSTAKGIFIWKIVRFDFDQGIVLLVGGETLKRLMYYIKKHISQKSLIQNIEDYEEGTSNKLLDQNLVEDKYSKCCCLDWAVWRGVYQAGPMETILTSAFASEDDCMVLKSLTSFFSAWKNKDTCQCCMACDLGTAFRECRNFLVQSCTWKPSSKEHFAISELRSIKQEVRRQGLRILLDILCHEVKDINSCGIQKTTLNTFRTPKRSKMSTPKNSGSIDDANYRKKEDQQFVNSKKEVYVGEKENVNLLSGLIAVMDRPLKKNDFLKEKKIIGSETERALQVAELKWKCFEEMKSDRSNSIGTRTYRRKEYTLKWQQVLEWVDNGFLEILLNEGLSNVQEDGKTNFIFVEDIANACLQVVRMLPGEGCNRIVNCLVSKLKDFIDVFTTIKISSPQEEGSTKDLLVHQKSDKFKISFKEMVQFCKLLSLLVKSSVAIASSFAKLDGLFQMLNLYSIIVKKFPIDVNNLNALEHDILIEALPGEVVGFEKFSKKLRPYTSINENTALLEKPKKIKPKARLPLEEILVPPQLFHALNASNLKVSSLSLDDNVQSCIQKTNLLHTSVKNVPMIIDGEIAIESSTNSPQILTTLIDVICETKVFLLQSLANMFESQSIILNECKTKMRSKLFVEARSLDLLSLLLLDLIGGHSNAFSSYINHKLNKIIFKIIFLLEKELEGSNLHIDSPQKNQFNFQYVEDGPWWSGPGPPTTRIPKIQLLGLMFVKLKERMDHILAFLIITIPGHVLKDGKNLEKYKKMTKENSELYISTLWINLAYLFEVLSNYISYWPVKESKSQHILRCCGGHFHQTLSLLANLGPIASWAPAQLLTMQSLLKLLSLCIEDSIIVDAKENWSDYQNFIWEMLIDTWAHWNCIQSYISWMTLEVCHGCLVHRINEFQKNMVEPIYLYYLELEKKLGMKRNCEDFFEKFQHSKLLPIQTMMFLHLVVVLAQQKFYTCNNSHQDGSANLRFRNNVLWFLHEIMNPLHGLLIMTIKNRPLRTCTNCKIETINPNFLLEISSQAEKCSLTLLTQIFNFNFFSSNAYIQEGCSRVCLNVYLSKKYLIPFLHVLYSSFKDLYTRIFQQTGLNLLCTLQETYSWKGKRNCLSSNQSSLESTTRNDNITNAKMEEMLNLCYLHVQVLHAIAKNLSSDGNQIFKDLCIMDFLVQEISLEYEFSQITETKSDSKFEMPTNSTPSDLQRLSLRKNPSKFKDLDDSHSSSNFVEACCMLSNLTQESQYNNSILFSHNYILQRGSNKCNINDVNLIVPLEQHKLDLDKKNYVVNHSCQSQRKINVISKDNNNVSTQLPNNSILRNANFGLIDDRYEFKNIYGIECNKNKVVYSGRFFDLNEEVERELATEEDDELNEGNKQSSIEESELINTIETQMQSNNIKETSLTPTSTRPTSFRNVEKIISSTLNTRPWVPKLNFSSALQKSQSNMASGSDSEIIHTEFDEQCCSNEDNNVERKSSNLSVSYEKERSKRCIYQNSSLHILLLELIISLMLDPEGALEVYYCDRFPMEHRKINAPFYLFYHINHVNNEYIVPILAKRLDDFHPSAYRILKLTWQAIFDPSLYTNRVRIAQGALSQVYTATRRTTKENVTTNELVVLKVNSISNSEYHSFRSDSTLRYRKSISA